MPQLNEIYELSLVKNRRDKGQGRVADGGLGERIITERDSDTLSHRIHTVTTGCYLCDKSDRGRESNLPMVSHRRVTAKD